MSGYESSYASDAAFGAFTIVYTLFVLAISIVVIVAMWKIYTKAGKPGWASLVPFYSNYVMFDIAMGNGWLFLLLFVPLVNAIMSIVVLYKMALAFGKGVGFALGLIFLSPIFVLILGFGDAEYIGPQ